MALIYFNPPSGKDWIMGTHCKGYLKSKAVKRLTKKDKNGKQVEYEEVIYTRGRKNR